MPAQYPGNSTTKAARAASGGGFESAIGEPNSGGTGAFAYSAPNGLADGQELTVTTDGSEGWDFGPAPTELATFGFGQGLLYSAGTGQTVQSHIDSFSGASWEWEKADFSPERQIFEEANGFRYMGTPPESTGGFWTWKAAQLLPENEKVFISNLSKSAYDYVNTLIDTGVVESVTSTEITLTAPYAHATNTDIGVHAAEDPTNEDLGKYTGLRVGFTNGSNIVTVNQGDPVAGGVQPGWTIGRIVASQWKGLRISDTGGYGSDSNLPGRNDFYTTPNNGTGAGWNPARGRWVYTDPAVYDGPGDIFYRKWIRCDTLLNLGNFATANGSILGNMIELEDPAIAPIYNDNYTNSSGGDSNFMTIHSGTRRVGAFSWQDYVKGVLNAQLFRADMMVQVGTLARVELTDSSDPATATAAYVLPPYKADWSTSSAKVLLWKGLFSDYTGKYLHFYDSDGVFRKSVAL